MIKVDFVLKNNFYYELTIKGHANYDEYGKDIVCASVSSIVITTVNALLRLDKDSIKYIQNEDLEIEVLKHNKTIDILIDNLIDLLQELEKQYSKYIEIRRC